MSKITLDQVQAMKPKEVGYLKIQDLTDEAFDFAHDAYEMNSCDKCGQIDKSEYLIWIGEDFTPFEAEAPNKEFYEAWGDQALCEGCYHDELDICRDVI